ncbi:MAG: rane protein [Actinomycetota bacterium]|jgi:membrane protein|nr:rane protein [Actinomycetota bacterium]MDQ1642028.1 rane protein [Actinomycetota bacterium]
MPEQSRFPDPDDDRKPPAPTDLHKASWKSALKRTVVEFKDDNCTDWAAALTYYGVLAMFPALIALTSLIGLVGDPKKTTDALLGIVDTLGPASAVDTFAKPIREVVSQQNTAGVFLVLGLLGALWSASGYVGAFSRASNAIYEVEEGRPFYKLRPLQLLLTLVCVVLVAVVALSLVVTGPLAKAVGDAVGVGSLAVTLWDILKWPVMALVVSSIFSLLYFAAPNVKQPRFRWFTLGGFVALLLWVVASALFALYVANFGSYNKTYGSLGAVVSFLVWLWITNIAVLFGAEFNAELERSRELQAGMTKAEETIQLPPRVQKKTKDRQKVGQHTK